MGGAFHRHERIDPELLKPSGFYAAPWWESNKRSIRKSIQDRKLAPFFKPLEESTENDPTIRPELEECPICFNLYDGGLNRAKCCNGGICTECYLQIKIPNPKRCLCPYCKAGQFEVVYNGPLSEEEQQRRLKEQQRVVELQQRMRREERERDEARQKKRREEREKREAEEKLQRKERAKAEKERKKQAERTKAIVRNEPAPSSDEIGDTPEPEMSPAAYVAQNLGSYNDVDDDTANQLEDLMLAEAIRLSLQTFTPENTQDDSTPAPQTADASAPLYNPFDFSDNELSAPLSEPEEESPTELEGEWF